MTETAPPLPGRMLPEVVTPFHTLLAMLAQDALEPFWAAMPSRPLPPADLRAAARAVLTRLHRDAIPEEALPEALSDALPPGHRQQVTDFVQRILWRDETGHLGLWKVAVSANQWAPAFPPASAGTVNAVMPAYRRDVVQGGKQVMATLAEHLAGHALSDWDLFLHAAYGFCFEATGEWPDSMILLSLDQMMGMALFERFLRRHVLTLPEADQQAVAAAVRAYWADLWGEEPEEIPAPWADQWEGDTKALAAAMLTETPEDAAAIPDAREMLG